MVARMHRLVHWMVLICTLLHTASPFMTAPSSSSRSAGAVSWPAATPPVEHVSRRATSTHVASPHQRQKSSSSLHAATSSSAASSAPWKSVVTTNPDLDEAIDEIAAAVAADSSKYTLAIFFTSSIYEATAFRYDTMFAKLSKAVPSLQIMVGSTAGAVVGPSAADPWGAPSEVEARASLSVTFAVLDGDVEASTFYVGPEAMAAYIKESDTARGTPPTTPVLPPPPPPPPTDAGSTSTSGRVALVFATEQAKGNLAQFVTALGDREGAEAFGAVASSVTSLHVPRVFIATADGDGGVLQRYSTGVAGLLLRGNVCVEAVVARSCVPVGPLFRVTEVAGPTGREIMAVERAGDAAAARSPLEQLDDVLSEVPNDQAYLLKRELLVGLVPDSPEQLQAKAGGGSPPTILASKTFFGQKPLSFDPLSGSITVPSSPGLGASFQFCVRDSPAARQDLLLATDKLRNVLADAAAGGSQPLAVMMVGSMERGNKVFRYQSYEALQLQAQLASAGLAGRVPVAGLFSYGAFARLQSREPGQGQTMARGQCALMEADSVYAVLATRPTNDPAATASASAAATAAAAAAAASSSVPVKASGAAGGPSEDVCTAAEASQFSDELDGVIVTKRDPESAHPVRVASMDYVVPEKAPQPKNVLESLVWDREKDVDRLRERFQLARALVQAKASEGKFPRRDLVRAVRDAAARNALLSVAGGGVPPLLVEVTRASLHNGKLGEEAMPGNDRAAAVLGELARDSVAAGAIAVGCNVDSGTFRGQFEDLEVVRTAVAASNVPVFCNDFVVYGYQLFRAKSSGADAVKLMASVLSTQDIEYLLKIAKALGLLCIVVVSSKVQLLDVLRAVPTVQALSVSSRNMRLWKIDAGKAARILKDPEVAAAIAAKRRDAAAATTAAAAAPSFSEGDFILMQEAFTSHAELVEAGTNGVDAVILGEELLLGKEAGIKATIEQWKLQTAP